MQTTCLQAHSRLSWDQELKPWLMAGSAESMCPVEEGLLDTYLQRRRRGHHHSGDMRV